MKKLIIIFTVSLCATIISAQSQLSRQTSQSQPARHSAQNLTAQGQSEHGQSEHGQSAKSPILRHSEYFKSISTLNNSTCYIIAFETYSKLETDTKQKIVNEIAQDYPDYIIVVSYGIYRELWKWNNHSKTAVLLDIFRTNENLSLSNSIKNNQNISKHPVFFHIGGMQNLDSNGNLNVYLNSRVGSYLLYNKLDLAISFTYMLNGNIKSETMLKQTMLGLMSKYYYPIQKYNISPNAGLDISITGAGTAPTLSLLLGVSWHVGPGSLDLGFRIHNNITTMLGYTFLLSK